MYFVRALFTLLFISPCFFTTANATSKTAPVSGFARSFIFDSPLRDATITILETGEKITTDENGNFGPIQYPIGQPLTLKFEKSNYKTFQSDTVIVPKSGLTTTDNNITFQVPNLAMYYALLASIGAKLNDDACHVVTTITARGKTLNDVPQGEPNAIVTLTPAVNATPFYFGIFESGPFKGYTNPFPRGLTQTTEDGGVAYFNLPPRAEPYTISASKKGVTFTKAQFICTKGAFINISPPRGPRVIGIK